MYRFRFGFLSYFFFLKRINHIRQNAANITSTEQIITKITVLFIGIPKIKIDLFYNLTRDYSTASY